jgi:hypothetical protein
VLLNMLYVFIMGAPTPLGSKMMDGIDGLRQYLTLAEKDRMNMAGAPAMSPQHFEKLLPYAVALGVENRGAGRSRSGSQQRRPASQVPPPITPAGIPAISAAAISPIASAASPPRWRRPSPRRFRARHPVRPPAFRGRRRWRRLRPVVAAAAAVGAAGKHSCLTPGKPLTPGEHSA